MFQTSVGLLEELCEVLTNLAHGSPKTGVVVLGSSGCILSNIAKPTRFGNNRGSENKYASLWARA